MSNVKRCVLGMDCGTTNIKAILLREDGEVIAEASRASVFLSPGPGMREQDAQVWWEHAVQIFRSLASQAGPAAIAGLQGICISSHTVSMLPVDENGTPLRNALTYQDSRSVSQLQQVLDTVGAQRYVQIVGGQPAVAFLPGKLLWYRTQEPELFAKTRCFLQASSYINFKLTGEMTSDLDQASRTQCLDSTTNRWSPEIGKAVGMDLDALLPPPRAVDEIIGRVTARAAAETGLPQGTPVLAGCSDAMAALYATGMSRMGDAGESSGTTSLVFVGSHTPSAADASVTTKPCAIEGMPWVYDAPIQSSGAALRWFIDVMGQPEQEAAREKGMGVYDYMNQLALEAEPGCNGLLFFPYLMGERAPLWNDYARGMFIGLGAETGRADLVRSVFEGTAFALRHVMETVRKDGARADRLYVCGGGAKSRTWSMIKASMLNISVYVLDERSGDVPLGDALIAGCATGLFENLTEAAARSIHIKEVLEPDPRWVRVYDELYPWFTRMYRDLDRDLEAFQDTLARLK